MVPNEVWVILVLKLTMKFREKDLWSYLRYKVADFFGPNECYK